MLKVEVTISREASDMMSSVLLDLNPLGLQVDDKDDVVTLTVYIDPSSFEDAQVSINNALTRLFSQGIDTGPASIISSLVADKDWVEVYKGQFKPIRIGRLLIKPSWEDVGVSTGDVIIELDPGLAFGTGSHPTTKGCLSFLQEYVSENDIVFDLGTGSGILAIAAAKLGASKVIAIDNDKEAIDVARENAARNGVAEKISFSVMDFADMQSTEIDVLVANLTAPVIITFLPGIVQKLKGMRVFIASGITVAQKDSVVTALNKNGLKVEQIFEKGDWVTVVSRFG